MSIKAGQVLHDANGFVVDRIQTGGVTNLNIPQETIREAGNFQTVAIVRDIPDLSFDIESLDVSTEIEALILGLDPTTTATGQEFDFINSVPLDVLSPFKSRTGAFNIVEGVAVPALNLESVTYRFGTKTNATQTFTLRGDSVFYVPGTPYRGAFTVPGVAPTGPYTITPAALPHDDQGTTLHVLSLCGIRPDGSYRRLFYGVDYTDTTTTFTLTAAAAADLPTGSKLHAVWGSATAATYPQSVHQDVTVKPAAVRGKDLDAYVDDGLGTLGRWGGIQSFEVTRRVTLDNDEEFGNRHYVAQDYDIAEVSGNVVIRARDPQELLAKVRQAAGVAAGQVIGAFKSAQLPLELRINHPDTGARLKTLYVPDARLTVPAIQVRAGQKLDVTFPFTSDSGTLLAYQGARP